MKNNKGRAEESGTTSQARRLKRESKQWSSLASTDAPVTSSDEMKKKLEALKKAQASAEKKLKEMEEEEAALKKAEANNPTLKKKGKSGPRSSSNAPGERSSSAGPSTRKPTLTSATDALKKDMLKERLEALKKEQEQQENPGGAASSSRGPAEGCAASSPNAPNLKKSGPSQVVGPRKKALKKANLPVVMVDWHNTVEKKNKIPVHHVMALARLMMVAEVVFISWVGSVKREKNTLQQMECLPSWALKKVKRCQTTFTLTGEGGKVHLACEEGCVAVFDDDPDVCWEAGEWGLEVFPVESRKQWGKTYYNFSEAVNAYLKKYHKGLDVRPEPGEVELEEIQLPVMD